MGKQRSSFAKLQRDRAKAAKKAAKQAARQNKANEGFAPIVVEEEESPELSGTVAEMFEGKGELSAPELLKMIEEIHELRDTGQLSEEDFEEAKVEIFARLPVD